MNKTPRLPQDSVYRELYERSEVLPDQAKRGLIRKYQARISSRDEKQAAFEAILLSDIGLVIDSARKHYRRGSYVSFEDLVEGASKGLEKALLTFDLGRKTRDGTPIKFSTHATWLIRAAITEVYRRERRDGNVQSIYQSSGNGPLINILEAESAPPADFSIEDLLKFLEDPRARLTLMCRYELGLTLQETADELFMGGYSTTKGGKVCRMTRANVKIIQDKALKKLKENLPKEYQDFALTA